MSFICSLFLLVILIIFVFSFVLAAVMFVIDILKFSKRPERFETIDKDLNKIVEKEEKTKFDIFSVLKKKV